MCAVASVIGPLCHPTTVTHQAPLSMGLIGKNTGRLPFPTQGSSPTHLPTGCQNYSFWLLVQGHTVEQLCFLIRISSPGQRRLQENRECVSSPLVGRSGPQRCDLFSGWEETQNNPPCCLQPLLPVAAAANYRGMQVWHFGYKMTVGLTHVLLSPSPSPCKPCPVRKGVLSWKITGSPKAVRKSSTFSRSGFLRREGGWAPSGPH